MGRRGSLAPSPKPKTPLTLSDLGSISNLKLGRISSASFTTLEKFLRISRSTSPVAFESVRPWLDILGKLDIWQKISFALLEGIVD